MRVFDLLLPFSGWPHLCFSWQACHGTLHECARHKFSL